MKSAKLVIKGSLPGLNEYTSANRSNRYVGSRMKLEAEQLIGWSIRQQIKDVSFHEPVYIRFKWIEKNRKRDLDNIAMAKKFILDALVRHKIIVSDGWIGVIGFEDVFDVDHDDPRIEVSIYEKGVTQ